MRIHHLVTSLGQSATKGFVQSAYSTGNNFVWIHHFHVNTTTVPVAITVEANFQIVKHPSNLHAIGVFRVVSVIVMLQIVISRVFTFEVDSLAIPAFHRLHTTNYCHWVARVWTNHQLTRSGCRSFTTHNRITKVRQDDGKDRPEVIGVSNVTDNASRELNHDQVVHEHRFSNQSDAVTIGAHLVVDSFLLISHKLITLITQSHFNAQDVVRAYCVLRRWNACCNETTRTVILLSVQDGGQSVGAQELCNVCKARASSVFWTRHTTCREVVSLESYGLQRSASLDGEVFQHRLILTCDGAVGWGLPSE
ncbi:hypothetical protein D3C79_657320 [compost metagenome]